MPKLKGLLDTARTKLTGLLGDFPQGFNAGAVAGFPGWAGDMAYMADTARLALTGADQQAAPENYVGTTDYIAKQAGYPVPQTLSGQLGAAVGGLMSPGPGDLAKFAPVLSAIPFWHGSPHKYDAVDLSKIGTGEGAQAYGWGYYGAQAKDTAEAYQNALSAPEFYIGNNKADPFIGADEATALALSRIFSSDAVMHTGKLNAEHFDKARRALEDESIYLGNEKLSKLASDAAEKIDGLKSQFLDSSAEFRMGGNMYRGEYRWPDPAKEAATPLTGEDLLQWDRPLSEQPESFRDALIGLPEIQARISASERQRVKLNELHPARIGKIPSADKPIDASRITGDEVISTLRQSGLSEADVSKKLLEMGIPGIRYLDGMSRDGGTGTYNYVMFDDKGIKLLERNGNPIEDFAARRAGKAKPYRELAMDEASRIQRASEQGYNTDVYHGTAEDVTAFDPAKFGASTGAHSAKQGVWTVSDETTAAGYAQYAANDAKIKALLDDAAKWEKKGDWDKYDEAVAAAEDLEKTNRDNDFMGGQNVMPLKVRGKYLEQDMGGAEFVDVERDIKTLIDKARRAGYDGVKFHNLADDVGRNARPATHVLTFDPKNIRSKNAAFDPAKKDSANLLAGAAATALGLGLAKQQLSEQERRNGM